MSPRRKRQRISEDGTAAVVQNADTGDIQPSHDAGQSAKLEKKQHQPRRELFVRSLPAVTTTEDLTNHFSQSYPIKHAVAVIDPSTKQCKGYGFVSFADAEDAQRAMEELNGSTLNGRKIKIDIAEPRHRDAETGTKIGGQADSEAKEAQVKKKLETHQPPKLIVRNLPWSIKEPEQLANLFRSYGRIKHAVVPKNKTGVMSGFGVVVIRGKKNAEKALEGVNDKVVDGRTLAVDWAVDRETWAKLRDRTEKEDKEMHDVGQQDGEEELGRVDGMNSESEAISEDADSVDAGSVQEDEGGSIEDDIDEEEDGGDQVPAEREDHAATLFIRNLPFTCTDEGLEEHFSQFGNVRYARIVLDPNTERPRGTGFVCFYKAADCVACLKNAPKASRPQRTPGSKEPAIVTHSILQNEDSDPTGQYTMEGRVLQVSLAVHRSEAARLTEEGISRRNTRDKDKRRLYLLSEGTVPSNSALYSMLSPSEIKMREASAKQRKALIERNPSLHLSLTRLSIRNIPRNITSKDLKALAREAVVGFAKDVKAGKRERLSKEELARGGEEMKEAERERKLKAKGVVKQATIVFEGREGQKMSESNGAGRSRGYGFIEYYTHRSALMGLRWLNGHAVGYGAKQNKGKKATKEDIQDRKKRLVVEFAIENAQVVNRRRERESKMRQKSGSGVDDSNGSKDQDGKVNLAESSQSSKSPRSRKRKRGMEGDGLQRSAKEAAEQSSDASPSSKDDKLAKRQKIIARKRMMRRTRKRQATA